MDFQGYRKCMSLKTKGASKLKFASAKLTGLPLEKALPSKLQQKGLFFYSPCKNVICVKGDKHTNSIPLHPYTLFFCNIMTSPLLLSEAEQRVFEMTQFTFVQNKKRPIVADLTGCQQICLDLRTLKVSKNSS